MNDPSGPITFLAALVLVLSLTTPISASPATDDVPDLSGTWSVDYQTTAVTAIPIVRDFHTITRARLVADIDQDGKSLGITTRVCQLDLDSDMRVARPVAPRAFGESLSETRRRGELVKNNDDWELRIHPVWETVGVQLDDPSEGKLPTESDDPRVIDQDRDGNPGSTILVRGALDAEIYVTQRSWDRWQGRIVDEDTIQGTLRWHTEQSIVGASHRILRRQPEATPHPDPAKNIFRMNRAADTPPC